jgi:gamma-glutamyl:cysteine ligase YbdK (ATP-grasp superfamily)
LPAITSSRPARFGFKAELADPIQRCTEPLGKCLLDLLDTLARDADDLGCRRQLESLRALAASQFGDAGWLRRTATAAGNFHDLTRAAVARFAEPSCYRPHA